MKRTGPDSPRRQASPPVGARQQPRTPDTDDTEPFEDSSDDSVEQAWSCVNDLLVTSVQREAAIRRCIAALPAGQRGGSLCLDDEHWQLFEAISWLDVPQDCAAAFEATYLARPGAPLRPGQCLECVDQVKAARSAVAALAMHKTSTGCSTVAGQVLAMAASFNACPLTCSHLLELVFRSHEPLVADVYSALCTEVGKGSRPSLWVCVVALVSLNGVPGGEQLDTMQAAASLCGESEALAQLVNTGLVSCRSIVHAAQALQGGRRAQIAADLLMMKEAIDGIGHGLEACSQDDGFHEVAQMIGFLQRWIFSILASMR